MMQASTFPLSYSLTALLQNAAASERCSGVLPYGGLTKTRPNQITHKPVVFLRENFLGAHGPVRLCA